MPDTRDTSIYDGTINNRPVTPKQPSNPVLDGSGMGTKEAFEKSKIGTGADLQRDYDSEVVATSQPNDCGSVNEPPSDVPPPEPLKQKILLEKFEPGAIIYYSTKKSEASMVQRNVLNPLIKDEIEKAVLENATIDTPFQFQLDLSSKDIVELNGGIVISKVFSTPALKEIGLEFKQISETRIQLTGTPKKDYNDKLYFYIHWQEKIKPATSKLELVSFTDVDQDRVYSKPFIINAHPKSLWKDLPCRGIDEDGKEYDNYGDYENKDAESSGTVVNYVNEPTKCFEVIAASIRGRSHAHVGKPRDDAYYYEFDNETGWNFATVADGAGSAKHSRKGSELATQTIVKTLRSALTTEFTKAIFTDRMVQIQRWKNEFDNVNGKLAAETEDEFVKESKLHTVFHQAVYQAYTKIHEEKEKYKAKHPNTKINDYHTTLIAAAFRWFPELNQKKGGWFIASYWVGDGGAAILTDTVGDSRKVFVLGEPDGGEFAGQTRFLTMQDEITAEKIHKRLRFTFCDSFEVMLLVTDGITDPFFPSEAAVLDAPRWVEFYEGKLKTGCAEEPNGCKEIFDNALDPLKKSEALLKWLGFWSKGNHDDRTILIVRPK